MAATVITGHSDIPVAVEAMKVCAAYFIGKPLRDEDLLEAEGKALARGTSIAPGAEAADEKCG